MGRPKGGKNKYWSKEEKLKLKRCFKPIHEVQETLKLRFDLKNFM